jgi:hypothetical protein
MPLDGDQQEEEHQAEEAADDLDRQHDVLMPGDVAGQNAVALILGVGGVFVAAAVQRLDVVLLILPSRSAGSITPLGSSILTSVSV